MSETNKANTVAFYKKALFEGDVQNAFRSYAGSTYRQHNPLHRGRHGGRPQIRRLDHGQSSGCAWRDQARFRGRGSPGSPHSL
jgi:hypothetical protein